MQHIVLLIFFLGIAGCDTGDSAIEPGNAATRLAFSEWKSPNAKALTERIAEDPTDASAYYWRGYSASHIGDLDGVHAGYRKAIELEPGNAWFRISYGWALFNAEAYPEALEQWKAAFDFSKGKHKEGYITLALGFYGVGEYQKAAVCFQNQVEREPAYAEFRSLQELTLHWTWREKQALYHLFDIWRYTY